MRRRLHASGLFGTRFGRPSSSGAHLRQRTAQARLELDHAGPQAVDLAAGGHQLAVHQLSPADRVLGTALGLEQRTLRGLRAGGEIGQVLDRALQLGDPVAVAHGELGQRPLALVRRGDLDLQRLDPFERESLARSDGACLERARAQSRTQIFRAIGRRGRLRGGCHGRTEGTPRTSCRVAPKGDTGHDRRPRSDACDAGLRPSARRLSDTRCCLSP